MLVLVARLTRLPELLWRLVASPDTMPRKRNTKGAAAKKKMYLQKMQVPALRLVLANKKKRRHSRKKVKKIRLKLRLKNPRKLRPKVRQKRLRQLPKTRNASLNKTNRLRQRRKKQKNQRQQAMQVRRQTNRKKKKSQYQIKHVPMRRFAIWGRDMPS